MVACGLGSQAEMACPLQEMNRTLIANCLGALVGKFVLERLLRGYILIASGLDHCAATSAVQHESYEVVFLIPKSDSVGKAFAKLGIDREE
jgi:hypothetical protein